MGSCQLHPPQHGISSTRFIWSVQEWLFLKNKYLISSLYDKLEQVVDKLRSDQRTFLKESHRTIKINLVHTRPMSRRLPLAISFQLAQVLYCSAKGFVVCKTIFSTFHVQWHHSTGKDCPRQGLHRGPHPKQGRGAVVSASEGFPGRAPASPGSR